MKRAAMAAANPLTKVARAGVPVLGQTCAKILKINKKSYLGVVNRGCRNLLKYESILSHCVYYSGHWKH